MPATKRLPVAFDPENPDKQSSDFLAPIWTGDHEATLLGLKSRKFFKYGMVVYTGREVSENDLFAKLIDATQLEPSNVDNCLLLLTRFIEKIDAVKIGSIITISMVDGRLDFDIVAKSPNQFLKSDT